ncbi:4-(cytidine 5'-diphospho)-2-C-methyl-D-erythritol kinase [uncultured Hoeflea sp.]|uniref:4-(cytidine 5'-diphospho)-2-C-methyl-D-erythritol kinase n=1 Tax=uncultured Hoeflea sp. TaxID=538666 RepID=UPI00260D46AA|nr:4-(cytidine 5'-diphospho)-2-C-methyl-D-erythritol kinase [uncultured Hoeflea sp.]
MPARTAPAKINLALHVTGQRDDGYHLLESLVVFTTLGDVVSATPDAADGLVVEGPEASALAGEAQTDNLVARARDVLRQAALAKGKAAGPVNIRLDKRLPVASGIGGGSADAAATLQLLAELWDYHPDHEAMMRLGLRLGADVPMCLAGRPLLARGIGEALTPTKLGFSLDLVIVNPRIGIATPAVFAALENSENPPLPQLPARGFTDREALLAWLRQTRNDLQTPARGTVPAIADCLDALNDAGARLARMSGSGASCFGIFDGPQAAQEAAARLQRTRPGWFVVATSTLPA